MDDILSMPGIPESIKEKVRLKDQDYNLRLLAQYYRKYLEIERPIIGDWVIFADGTERRITHFWNEYELREGGNENVGSDWIELPWRLGHVQTGSTMGSYHMSESGYMSYSGSLYRSVPALHMTKFEAEREGPVWIWNRGWSGASRGRTFNIKLKVWILPEETPDV